MKKFLALLLASLLLLSLVSCGGGEYKDDVAVVTLSYAAISSLAVQEYAPTDGNYLSDFVAVPTYVEEHHVVFSKEGNDLNEMGFFRVKEGYTGEMKNVLKEYLEESLAAYRDWYNSYIPEETPKLENAEIKVYGNYVVYAILSEADKEAAFAAVEDVLTK